MPTLVEYPPKLPPKFGGVPLNGGRVISIAVDPTESRHIVAVTQFGGLWRSTNTGRYWHSIDSLQTVYAHDVGFAPDGRTLVATLAHDNQIPNGGGIYVSEDSGVSWSRPPTAAPPPHPGVTERISGYGISFAPDEPRRVIVGTDFGVATSLDAGITWTHEMVDTSPLAVRSVLALASGAAIALTAGGVHEKTGGTWRLIRAGDFATNDKQIDVSPLDSDHVFIMESYERLWLYERAGMRWTAIPLPGGQMRGPFVRVAKSLRIANGIDIWIGLGANLGRAACTTIAAVRALTAASWELYNRTNGVHEDSGDMGLDARGYPVLYGSDGGFFRPDNTDANRWASAPVPGGLNSYQITDVTATVSVGALSLYFATQDNGLWASPDGGVTWPAWDCAEGFFLQAPSMEVTGVRTTVAYGKVGCKPECMFSDANFANQRAVPDAIESGGTLTGAGQAFRLWADCWIRFRHPADGSDSELWVSTNDGNSWRQIASFTISTAGIAFVSRNKLGPVAYVPVQNGVMTPVGINRHGLVRLRDMLGTTVRTYGEADMIYLPDNGSLGVRATEFDRHSIFGVNPRRPYHLIAPDVVNGVVWVSHDYGRTWAVDIALTDLVTSRGKLLLWAGDVYRLQVTQISFDPFDEDHILVGTRDAGVVRSTDGGRTWARIPHSERARYITGFAFDDNGTVIVSTYGRGLWKLNLRILPLPYQPEHWCTGRGCSLRLPHDPAVIVDPPDWRVRQVIVVYDGHIDGLTAGDGRVERLSITAGARYLRYAPVGTETSDVTIVTAEPGFGDLTGPLAALEEGQVIRAIVLDGDRVEMILSGHGDWTEADVPTEHEQPPPPETSQHPYLRLSSKMNWTGVPIVGEHDAVSLYAKRFQPGLPVTIAIGYQVVDTVTADENGEVRHTMRPPDGLPYGDVIVRLAQNELTAIATFVRAAEDEDHAAEDEDRGEEAATQ